VEDLIMNLSPEEIIEILGLTPHPTCGLVKQTYLSKDIIPKNYLPFPSNSDRPVGSVLYFMLTQQRQIILHKICSDQMYHFYFGAPIEVLLLYPDKKVEIKLMGHDIKSGMMPQLFIPRDTFHATRSCGTEKFSLLGTSEWIGINPEDIELGDIKILSTLYPNLKEILNKFQNNGEK
jgi:uncharacterized protein